MIRGIIPALLILLICSCSKKDKIPNDVIAQSEMQEILWDLSRADQFTQELSLKDSSQKRTEIIREQYSHVFAVHKITPSKFKKSYAFYTHHPEMLKTMLDSLQVQKTREVERETLKIYQPKRVSSDSTLFK